MEFLFRRRDISAIDRVTYRRLSNIGLIVIGSLISTIFVRVSPIFVSNFAESKGLGLFNVASVPFYFRFVFSIIILDFFIYIQHRAFHYFNFFWKFHRIHHLDNILDATSALRFHPVEIVLSLLFKSLIVIIFGISAEAVMLFSVILSSMAIFNHANLQLPFGIDKLLSFIVVTPNFHVIHHHPDPNLHNSNFGFNLSLWDYLFKTYKKSKTDDFSNYECGLSDGEENSLKGMLFIPFKK